MPTVRGAVHGVGIDVADTTRFDRLLRHGTARFAARWFTRTELDQAHTGPRLAAALAARFAVKEAVWKALRVGSWAGPVPWPWIDVDLGAGAAGGDVSVTLHDDVARAARRVGAGRVLAAVGGSGGDVVVAVALVECAPGAHRGPLPAAHAGPWTARPGPTQVHYADREVPEPDLGTRTTKGWRP